MAVFDTTFLRLLLRPDADPPNNPETGEPVARCRERIEYLIEVLEARKETILVPTPVLAELLVKEESFGVSHLDYIDGSSAFRIVSFDQRAAIEVASMTRESLLKNEAGSFGETKTKVKFDRQILATAKVNHGGTIYSDDANLRKVAKRLGLSAIGVHQLPLKPNPPQGQLNFSKDTGEQ